MYYVWQVITFKVDHCVHFDAVISTSVILRAVHV